MAKYIDKDALVAEIKRLKNDAHNGVSYHQSQQSVGLNNELSTWEHLENAFMKVLKIIDTLEVKQVDLDFFIHEEWDALGKTEVDCLVCGLFTKEEFNEYTKHVFELGLQARTDKELVEEAYSHIDSIKDTADRMTSGNFMHNRAAIKFSANTIAKVLELIGLKVQKGE